MTDWTQLAGKNKFFVPEFEVKVDGQVLKGKVKGDILNVAYRDSVDELDSFEVLVSNWDQDKLVHPYSPGDQFDPGRKLELRMGYVGEIGLRLMIRGEITSIRPTFPTRRYSRMVVSGLSVLHTFRKKQISELYLEMKDSEIAEEIGGRLGVTMHTDAAAKAAEEKITYLIQDNQYDIVFLYERARRNGYDLFVEKDSETVYFGPSENVTAPRNTVRYGVFSLEFEPQLSIVDQVKAVTVRSWSHKDKKLVEQRVKNQGGAMGVDIGKREEIVVNQPVQSGKEARTLAEAILTRTKQKMVTATGTVIGIPEIRAGTVLEIQELDSRFTGEYFVTATQHIFDKNGYVTKFECRREDV
ncbi:MAG: phage late control D family protein [bacterium]|nr:phage late control D family protein [bacterium]